MAEDIKSVLEQCPDAKRVIQNLDLVPLPTKGDVEKANYFMNITLQDQYV